MCVLKIRGVIAVLAPIAEIQVFDHLMSNFPAFRIAKVEKLNLMLFPLWASTHFDISGQT